MGWRLLVRLRWLVLIGWIAVAVGAWVYLPAPDPVSTSALQSLLPRDAPALRVEESALAEFEYPALARISVVVQSPSGLSLDDQAELVEVSAEAFDGGLPDLPEILAAIPVSDVRQNQAGEAEATTAVVYLFIDPSRTQLQQVEAAERFAETYVTVPPDAEVAVTGAFAAVQAQADEINRALPWVEAGTLIVVVLIVSARFRTVLAPLVTLAGAGVAYVVALRGLSWLTAEYGLPVPEQLEPLLVVLLIGLMTDYAVFLMSAVRDEMARGVDARPAVATAAADIGPIIVTAALTVAAGAASLLVAEAALFRDLAPGMAVTVVVTMLVAVTFLPALIAVLGGLPVRRPRDPVLARFTPPAPPEDRLRRRVLRQVVRRPVAALVLLVGIGALALGSWPLTDARLGVNLVENLPSTADPARGRDAATAGFPAGIIAPSMLVVTAPDVAERRDELSDLQRSLAQEPGVGTVLGPANQPVEGLAGVLFARSGDAARLFVVLDPSPYGAAAVDTVTRLQERTPELAAAAGLEDAELGWAGDTALSEAVVDMARGDLWRVGALAMLVQLVILMVFLRAVVVPLVLLALTAGAVTAALGTTSWLFSTLGGDTDGLTFFVPISVAVLLLAFGSDYNIFLVGRIRTRAQRVPSLRQAVVDGGARASRAIGSAGLALAASFAMLGLIQLGTFQQFAVAMVIGVLIDTFLVRSYLVPAALVLLGTKAARAAGSAGSADGAAPVSVAAGARAAPPPR
jgi:RND superfamily putative drug exporter